MNTRLLLLVFLCVFARLSSQADTPTTNPFGYSRLDKGERITFEQLDKKCLGRQCTVYLKPGVIYSPAGGMLPQGAVTTDKETKRNILIGEFFALEKDGVLLRWFYEKNRTASTQYGVESDKIDYIIFK